MTDVELARREIKAWIKAQREALPERREAWAHGAAETLCDLEREVERVFGPENALTPPGGRREWAYRLLDYIERRDRDSDLAWAVDTITALVDSLLGEGIALQDYELDALTHLKERAS